MTDLSKVIDSLRPTGEHIDDLPAAQTMVPAIISPPLDSEGNPLTRTPDNTFVPNSNNTPVSFDSLNSLTDSGRNTRAILENGLQSVLQGETQPTPQATAIGNAAVNATIAQAAQPGSAPGAAPGIGTATAGSGGGLSAPMSVPSYSGLTENSRMVGQQLWNYKVRFFNNAQPDYTLPPHLIKQLVVEDDLLSWPLRGYIVVDNRMEGFERSSDASKHYSIRSDSRDELFIEVFPAGVGLPDSIWKLKCHAVIYDVEDIPHTNMTDKAKKLYFWDKNFQFLLEKNVEWSTAKGQRFRSAACPAPIAHATDEQRSMLTGEAIASVLAAAGYSIFDMTAWDMGSTKINFVAKADWSVWDIIQYILEQHVSEQGNDICLLVWNRATEKLNLVPLMKFFEKAGKGSPGELQVEHLFFEEEGTGKTANASPYKAPYQDGTGQTTDIKAYPYNMILNYRFAQTSGLDNSKAFVSRPVYSHWHKHKQFDLDFTENEIETVKTSHFKTKYVSKLLGSDYPVFVLNQTKTQQYAIDPQFSPVSTLEPHNDRKVRSVIGKGKILQAGVFLNQCLSLRLHGSTHRLAGTFIGVDRLTQSSDNNYDYSLCGQYFVVNVKHIIQQQKFVNDVTMVKIHAYQSLPSSNEGIF